jgi:hypothetical protein
MRSVALRGVSDDQADDEHPRAPDRDRSGSGPHLTGATGEQESDRQ